MNDLSILVLHSILFLPISNHLIIYPKHALNVQEDGTKMPWLYDSYVSHARYWSMSVEESSEVFFPISGCIFFISQALTISISYS